MRARRGWLPAEDRFWRLVDTSGPLAARRPDLGSCWLWGGSVAASGYGVASWAGRRTHAHRVAWGLSWGSMPPAGLRLEHFACGNRRCVNPGHVRPALARESLLGDALLADWNARHDVCLRGHAFAPANSIEVPGGRACRACRAEVARARRRDESPGG